MVNVPNRHFPPGNVLVELFTEINWDVIGGFCRPPFTCADRSPETVENSPLLLKTRLAWLSLPVSPYISLAVAVVLVDLFFQHSFQIFGDVPREQSGTCPQR